MKTIRTPDKCAEAIADNFIIRFQACKSREDVIKLVNETMADYLQDWTGSTYQTVQAGTKFYSVPEPVADRLTRQLKEINDLKNVITDLHRERCS